MLWLPTTRARCRRDACGQTRCCFVHRCVVAAGFLLLLCGSWSGTAWSQTAPSPLRNKTASPIPQVPPASGIFDQPLNADEAEMAERLARAEAEIQALKQRLSSPDNVFVAPASGAVSEETSSVFEQRFQALSHRFDELQAKIAPAKLPSVEVHGVFQADTGWFSQNAASRKAVGDIQDGSDFRRARLSANGAIADNMNYFLQMDFAFPGRPTFTDLWFEVTKVPVLGNVRIGQWKQPFSLEVVSSFRYTTFAERSLLFQAFTPFRHIALGFYDWSEDERMTWAASVYRTGQDQYGGSIADNGGYGAVGRITALPWYDEDSGGSRYLHLGAGYNFVAPGNQSAQFRTIPEYFIGSQQNAGSTGTSGIALPDLINGVPFFADTGKLGVNHYNLVGTELLFVEGPFSLQSEFMYNFVSRTKGNAVQFPGLYVTAGYFLTGEHRPYLRKAGAIDRIKVLRNFGKHDECGTGWGAWELAARYSSLNLNDSNVPGGRLQDMTLGANWYLNSFSKIQFNYIRAFLDRAKGHSHTDIFGLRAQMDF